MPEVFKVTYGINQANTGWTESWYSLPGLSAKDFSVKLVTLLERRAGMAWTFQTFGGVRISSVNVSATGVESIRRSVFLQPGDQFLPAPGGDLPISVPTRGVFIGTGRDTRPDQVRACLQLAVRFDTDRYTKRYLAGVSDRVTGTNPGGIDYGGYELWTRGLFIFLGTVATDGWQVKARTSLNADPFKNPIRWIQRVAEPKLLGAVFNNTDAIFADGNDVQVSGVAFKPRTHLTLNGHYRVDSTDTAIAPGKTTYWLAGTQDVNPATIKVMGKVRRRVFQLFDVEHVNPTAVGTHKRGAPFPRLRGSRRTYVSIDP